MLTATARAVAEKATAEMAALALANFEKVEAELIAAERKAFFTGSKAAALVLPAEPANEEERTALEESPPDGEMRGTLRIHVSHGVEFVADHLYVKLRLGTRRVKVSQTVRAGGLIEHRWDEDFTFGGTYGELATTSLLLSGWESHPASGQIDMLGEAKILLASMMFQKRGVLC